MAGLKKMFVWVALLLVGYHGLDYVKVHTSGDVTTYKRFAKALMQNDYVLVRQISDKSLAAKLAEKRDERNAQYRGVRVLFSYYDIVSAFHSSDGKTSRLVVDQISRVVSNGQPGFWGDGEIRVRHAVELEHDNHLWKVKQFTDPVMY